MIVSQFFILIDLRTLGSPPVGLLVGSLHLMTEPFMNQLFAEIVRIAGLAICLQLYGLVHTLAANYGTDENKAKKIERDGFFSSHTWKVALGGAVFLWVLMYNWGKTCLKA